MQINSHENIICDERTIKEYKRSLNDVPSRTILEEIGNSITHGVGALLAIFMFILMLLNSHSVLQNISSFVYGLSMIIMMSMSSLYHAFGSGLRVKRLFRRFDYSSIYLLIGGTYAPILLLVTGGVVGHIVFLVQWIIIVTGITFVSIFGPGRLKWLHFPLYFIIGWCSVMFVPLFKLENYNLLFYIMLSFRFTRRFSRDLSIVSAKIAYIFKSAGICRFRNCKSALT